MNEHKKPTLSSEALDQSQLEAIVGGIENVALNYSKVEFDYNPATSDHDQWIKLRTWSF